MQQNNFNNPNSWVGDGFEWMKRMQIAMIEKAYPDYREDRDYVLWIVPDLYHPYKCDKVSGKITIFNSSNNVFDEGELHVASLSSFKVRQPYPNKHIYQLSYVSSDKRKKIYGIPLIFHSFDELKEISSISIDWTIYDTDPACSVVFTSHLSVNYNINFPENVGKNRFFTLFTYDRLSYCFGDGADKEKNDYYLPFKDTIGARGHLNVFDGPDEKITINELFDLKWSGDRNAFRGFAAIGELIDKFYSIDNLLPWFPDIDYIRDWSNKHGILEVSQYLLEYIRQDVTLHAAEAADFVPEPAFGFKEV